MRFNPGQSGFKAREMLCGGQFLWVQNRFVRHGGMWAAGLAVADDGVDSVGGDRINETRSTAGVEFLGLGQTDAVGELGLA